MVWDEEALLKLQFTKLDLMKRMVYMSHCGRLFFRSVQPTWQAMIVVNCTAVCTAVAVEYPSGMSDE
eukprot:68373-Amphidinium_carterae.1